MATILLVDDDAVLNEVLGGALASEGHTVHLASTAAEALVAMESVGPDLILLDLTLPDTDGLTLLLRRRHADADLSIPLIVLSGRARQVDRVLSLKFGADDFVAKPFDYDELLARIEAVLRRAGAARQPACASNDDIRSGALVISTRRASVEFAGQPLALTPTEFHLLVALVRRSGQILSRQRLAAILWGYADSGTTHMINVHVARLRAKLRAVAQPVPLETVHRQGFIWRDTDCSGFKRPEATDGA